MLTVLSFFSLISSTHLGAQIAFLFPIFTHSSSTVHALTSAMLTWLLCIMTVHTLLELGHVHYIIPQVNASGSEWMKVLLIWWHGTQIPSTFHWNQLQIYVFEKHLCTNGLIENNEHITYVRWLTLRHNLWFSGTSSMFCMYFPIVK